MWPALPSSLQALRLDRSLMERTQGVSPIPARNTGLGFVLVWGIVQGHPRAASPGTADPVPEEQTRRPAPFGVPER